MMIDKLVRSSYDIIYIRSYLALCKKYDIYIFFRIVTGCCSQQDLSLRQPHRFRMSPASSAFNESAWKDRNLLVLVEY